MLVWDTPHVATSQMHVTGVRTGQGAFYVWMGYAFAGVAIAGFVPTYWAPVAAGTFTGGPLLHLHGLLFTAWTLLFIVQARLAVAGRYERHRMLGMAGIAVATAMLGVGLLTAIHRMHVDAATSYAAASRAFAIVPVTVILSFAAAVGAAIANVRRPDAHMRLMLVAGVTILPPPLARFFFLLLAPPGSPAPGVGAPPPVEFSLMPAVASDMFLAAAMLYDWRTRGRPHRAYVIAAVLLLAVQFGRVPLAHTTAWHAVAGWLMRFSG